MQIRINLVLLSLKKCKHFSVESSPVLNRSGLKRAWCEQHVLCSLPSGLLLQPGVLWKVGLWLICHLGTSCTGSGEMCVLPLHAFKEQL